MIMKRRMILIVGIIVVLVTLVTLVAMGIFDKPAAVPTKEAVEVVMVVNAPEFYAIAGVVVKVDVENKYLIIASGIAPEKEVKVKLDEKTEILKLTVVKPPAVEESAVEESPMTMADIKVGDYILVTSTQSIFGKTEIADVWKIRILPSKEAAGVVVVVRGPELYAIAGDVVKVDVENKYLIIANLIIDPGIAPEKGKEVKVKLDEKTEILKLTVVKPPAVEESPVTIADIKVGDHILVESTQSIFGKTEIADVWKIRILP